MFQTLFLLFLCIQSVNAHGFLYSPRKVSLQEATQNTKASQAPFEIRGEVGLKDAINVPTKERPICRGHSQKGKVTPIALVNGKQHTVTLAIGAKHIGPCVVNILDADNPSAPPVEIGRMAIPGAYQTSEKYYGCGVAVDILNTLPDLQGNNVTETCDAKSYENCIRYWTFTVKNADQIKCTNCVLQWQWYAQHNPSMEYYENCADVTVTTSRSEVERQRCSGR